MTARGRRRTAMSVAAFLAAAAGCGDVTAPPGPDPRPAAPDDTLPYAYTVPPDLGDGWKTASLEDVGMDPGPLTRLVDLVRAGTYARIHGLVVVKDGRLVFEEYFNGVDFEAAVGDSIVGDWTAFGPTTPHNLASVTKSITATLIGAAIHRGLLPGVDTAVYDFYPEVGEAGGPARFAIRLEHLLTMTSGLAWDEHTYGYGDPRNDINALFSQSDPIGYILDRPLADAPGTRWLYNGGGTIVLGDVVEQVAGVRLERFADDVLFGPLGISDREWLHLADGVTYASGDLRLRPRDMARIGQLHLQDGVWNGRRILPPEWVERATLRHAETWNPGWGYGYQWWIHDFTVDGEVHPSWGARGWGGQMITVLPEDGVVVVQTGGNYHTADPADAVIRRFVIPALR